MLNKLNKQRVALIGSALGGGASQIIDALVGNDYYEPVAIFDSDLNVMNKSILGVPVIGTTDQAVTHFKNGLFDVIIIAIGGDLQERSRLYHYFKEQNIPFVNIIDKTAQIRSEVTIGNGNVLLSGVYLGPHVSIGDNCYLITNTVINHHSRVGSHCYFSTSVSLAGRVDVGDRVRFDTASGAKANVSIGDDCVIPAGFIVTENMSNDISSKPTPWPPESR